MASLTAASTPDQPAQTPPEHAAMASLELGASASPHVAHGGRGGVAPELAAGGGGTPQGAVRRVLRGTPRSAYSAASTPDRVIVGTPPTPMSERAIAALALQSPASIPPPGPKSTPRGGPEVGVHKAAVAPPTPPASGGSAPASDKATALYAAALEQARAEVRREYEKLVAARDAKIRLMKRRLSEQTRAARELGAIFSARDERLRRTSASSLPPTGEAGDGAGATGDAGGEGAAPGARNAVVSPSSASGSEGGAPYRPRRRSSGSGSDRATPTPPPRGANRSPPSRLVPVPEAQGEDEASAADDFDAGVVAFSQYAESQDVNWALGDSAVSVTDARGRSESGTTAMSVRSVPDAAHTTHSAASAIAAMAARSPEAVRPGERSAGRGRARTHGDSPAGSDDSPGARSADGTAWSGSASTLRNKSGAGSGAGKGAGAGSSSSGGAFAETRPSVIARRRGTVTDALRVLDRGEEPPAHAVWGWGVTPGTAPGHPNLQATALLAPAAPLTQASVGSEHVLFLSTSGDVYQWNVNTDGHGQGGGKRGGGGGGDDATREGPRWVSSLGLDKAMNNTRVVSVACGGAHCLALTDVGGLYSWGVGDDGRLGHGNVRSLRTPRVIMKLLDSNVVRVAAGGAHSAAVSADGTCYTWGRGRNGRLGLGDGGNQYQPRTLKSLKGSKVVEIACGRSFTVAVCDAGNVYCWGRGREGQCGPGPFRDASKDVMAPVALGFVGAIADVKVATVSCGHSHTLALTQSGECIAWGYNQFRQLGFGDLSTSGPGRTPLSGIMHREDSVVAVAAGAFHSLAQTAHGALLSWGRNVCGELGVGDCSPKVVPHRVRLPAEARAFGQIVAGHGYTLILHRVSTATDANSPHPGEHSEAGGAASVSSHRRKSLPAGAIQSEANKEWEQKLADRHRKWDRILANWESQRSASSTVSLWRLGVPPRLRKEVWPRAIGNALKINTTLFDIYRKRAAERSASGAGVIGREFSIMDIDPDLARTFPELEMFGEEGPLGQRLRETLEVCACYRPDLGYVQGMSYYAAVLCLHIDDPMLVFQCFANLIVKEHVFEFFKAESETLSRYYAVFDLLLADANPKLYKHMRHHSVPHEMYLFRWLQTMFMQVLPMDTAARVWDWFFLDGAVVLFRTAVALLSNLAPYMYKDDSMETTMDVVSKPQNNQEAWAAATDQVALFKTLESVSVPSVVAKKLDKLLHDPFFYRTGAARDGGARRSRHRHTQSEASASASSGSGGSHARRVQSATHRRATANTKAALKLREVLDF